MSSRKRKEGPVPPGGLLQSVELSQLVAELNADGPPLTQVEGTAAVTGSPAALERRQPSPAQREPVTELMGPEKLGERGGGRVVDPDSSLGQLLLEMRRRRASDLHLVVGQRTHMRIGGSLSGVGEGLLATEGVAALFGPLLSERDRRLLARDCSVDLALHLAGAQGARFRVNLHRQQGGDAAAVRLLPEEVPQWRALGLPRSVLEAVEGRTGLVFVCGPTGSGKSTTLAAQVDHLNREGDLHILTIEEPVEYVHRPRRSLIQQIEVGTDAPSFPMALRSALRQDPDVILLGEMRDAESLQTALSAAETGHLILSTLHTADAAQSIHRIIDLVPEGSQQQVRQQLALSLHAVICQRLLPRSDRVGVVPAVEILRATYPVRQHIRQGAVQKIYNEITTGRRHGMISLEASLVDLVRGGLVSLDEARLRARRPDEFDSLLRG